MIANKNIDGGNAFDWGRTSKDYAKFRDIYPPEFYKSIIDLSLCVKGQDVLDLGTGTGVLPRNMYHYGASFTGADISANQIAEAKRLSKEHAMNIKYIVASAENINCPDESFDVITACQCYVYFDKEVVLPKIHRMLKKDGCFCILWMAWLPFEEKIAGASEELILKYNPAWTGAGSVRPELKISPLESSLFYSEHSILYDIKVPFTRESWHGRIKACRGIGASSLSTDEIEKFEQEHKELLNQFPNKFDILHYVTIQTLRKRTL